MPEESVGAADLAMCECEPCKRKGGRPNTVESRIIHEYTSMPRGGWRTRGVVGEAGAPTFGIELETDAPGFRFTDLADRPDYPYLPWDADADATAEYTRLVAVYQAWDVRNRAHRARQQARFVQAGNMTAEEAVSMASPRGLWHAKHDGSVSGPEFASQPCTLAYWRAQRGHLAGMFRSLLHGGMRSHDGDHCGFHVNIGTDAFGTVGRYATAEQREAAAGHLERFATLVCMNERWSIRMSQRTHRSASWARFESLSTPNARKEWARNIAQYGYTHSEHTAVLNASHEGRIEFRLPRGTLRLDRFYAKLEWAASMLEYTRNPANVVRPSDYMRWCKAQGEEYAMLVAYMSERFNAARFGQEDEVAA